MTTSRAGKPIVIADYDPAWPEKFRAERALIYRACGRERFTRIEHVGSTAVPGLAAKPIIDTMPGVRSLADVTPEVIAQLAGIGYEYVPAYELPSDIDEGMPERRYFRKDEGGARAFHMHLVEHGSAFWVKHLRFRNCMRAFPSLMREYAALKRDIAAEYNAAMDATWASRELNVHYTNSKTEFVERALTIAEGRIARSRPIEIVEHDPAWAAAFERERAGLASAAGDLAVAIEHVGSTSVPGLAAKPKLDIAMGLRSMADVAALAGPLGAIAYENAPVDENAPDWVVFTKREGGPGTVNLHLVEHGGTRWADYLAFRDYLRGHPEAARAYGALKRELAAEFGRDRMGYPEAKDDFVREVLERARGA